MYQHKDIAKIEKILNEDFVGNKLSILFVNEKTESILFVSMRKYFLKYS